MEHAASQHKSSSFTGWLSTLPVFVLLITTLFLFSGQIIHSQLLKIGESTWDHYFLLRTAGMVEQPTCNANPDIDARVDALIKKRQAKAANDPLADILGESSLDRDALRQSLLAARDNCRASHHRYQMVQDNVTPGVIAYRNVEGAVAWTIASLGDYKKLLLCLLVLICGITTTFARHHIALRPIRTRRDFMVSMTAQVVSNALLLVSAVAYLLNDMHALSNGVRVVDFYLHWVWITGFALLTLASLYLLLRPPHDLEDSSTSGWGKAILTIPLYTFMALTTTAQFWAQGYFQGLSVYLNMMMSLSTMFLNLALYIFVGMMLKQTRLTHLLFDVLRPWNLSPELMSFVVLAIAAVLTAYTGASGIFVIAAGATIYSELRRVGARKQLALAATAMSGSMGVVLRPCLLVVIIAALNKSVTTTELFHSGGRIFFISLITFFIYSQFARTSPARVAPFARALPASLKRLVPLVPYGIIVGAVLVFFNDVLARHLDEFSAPIILPAMLLAVLLYEKFSRHFLHLFSLFLAPMLVLSALDIVHGYAALQAGQFPSGMGAVEMENMLWGLFWRNLVLAVFLILQYTLSSAANEVQYPPEKDVSPTLKGALRFATRHTTGETGALLMLMALSVGTSGIIERSGIFDAMPDLFPSVWVATTILVITMVIIGMFMDPFGAVILVNATIAQIAYHNGIAPLHFWMISLVAFELGYLTPPVALNHLLTRQVVGDDEVESARLTEGNFYRRHEKYLLPILVMGTVLLLVAYVPLMSSSVHHWLFQVIHTG